LDHVNVAITMIGILVLVAGALTQMLRRIWCTGPMLAVLTGVLVGSRGLGWLNPEEWGKEHLIFEQVIRLTLAISLMAVALRIPRLYMVRQLKPLLLLLGPIMVCMWLSSAVLAGWLLGLAI
jgi:NhaP-type Na+/H+ or K+/H+ antiporter